MCSSDLLSTVEGVEKVIEEMENRGIDRDNYTFDSLVVARTRAVSGYYTYSNDVMVDD